MMRFASVSLGALLLLGVALVGSPSALAAARNVADHDGAVKTHHPKHHKHHKHHRHNKGHRHVPHSASLSKESW